METTQTKIPTIVSKDVVYNGHFKVAKYGLSYEGTREKQFYQECFERGDSVAALVIDSENEEFIFTEQYRIGSQDNMIEIMAGSMDKSGETPIDALKRELKEELGYEIVSTQDYEGYQEMGCYYVSPGGTSERVHIFIIDQIKKVSDGGGVEDENIKILRFKYNDFYAEYVSAGKIKDMKTILALILFYANY